MIESPTISVAELADLIGLSVGELLRHTRGFYANPPLIPPQPTTLLGVDSDPEESRMDISVATELIELLVEEKLIKPVVELPRRLESISQTKRQVYYQNSVTL